jgi:hypothetical protein
MRDPLAQFRKRPADSSAGETSDSEGYVAFGAKDNVQRLKIRRVEPPMRAPGYNYLLDIAYDREGTSLVLVYTFLLVTVRGRNLLPVVMAVESGTCDFIQEFDPESWKMPAVQMPFIHSIEVEMQESSASLTASERGGGQTLH